MSKNDLTTPELKTQVQERAARVSQLRQAYQRMYNNPFRTNSTIFDPAPFRYEAARAYAREFYKITPRSLVLPVALVAATVILQKYINKEMTEKEEAIRSGEKTYYERALWSSKFLN